MGKAGGQRSPWEAGGHWGSARRSRCGSQSRCYAREGCHGGCLPHCPGSVRTPAHAPCVRPALIVALHLVQTAFYSGRYPQMSSQSPDPRSSNGPASHTRDLTPSPGVCTVSIKKKLHTRWTANFEWLTSRKHAAHFNPCKLWYG